MTIIREIDKTFEIIVAVLRLQGINNLPVAGHVHYSSNCLSVVPTCLTCTDCDITWTDWDIQLEHFLDGEIITNRQSVQS